VIVWLASYPRSGNTLLRATFRSHFGIESCSVYASESELPLPGWQAMAGHVDRPDSLQRMAEAEETYFVKTHELQPDHHRAIYVVRDGCHAAVSYAHYIRRFSRGLLGIKWLPVAPPRNWNFRRVLRRVILGECDFGSWSDHVRAWTASRSVVVVRFEDLVADPAACVGRALAEVGHRAEPRAAGTVPTFTELKKKWPKFFRKGAIARGSEEMPGPLLDLFWEKHGTVMRALGYAGPGANLGKGLHRSRQEAGAYS
jgi:hypothetical protein